MTTAISETATDLGGLIDHLSEALRDDSPAGEARAAETLGGPVHAATERFVGVRIAEESFAIPMTGVIEIQRLSTLTPLPGIAEWLLGVMNFHGDVLSVVDPRPLLGLGAASPSDKSRRLMVLQSSNGALQTGLVVDATLGVKAVAPSAIRFPEGELKANLARYLRGVCEFDDRLFSVLDVERLLDDLASAIDST